MVEARQLVESRGESEKHRAMIRAMCGFRVKLMDKSNTSWLIDMLGRNETQRRMVYGGIGMC